ncbi:MAG TPA: hypothetical protein VLV81_13345 [Acidimicrobiia bacterium]|nr:hypothetical protein [Acidimicrobiia bacterium]
MVDRDPTVVIGVEEDGDALPDGDLLAEWEHFGEGGVERCLTIRFDL